MKPIDLQYEAKLFFYHIRLNSAINLALVLKRIGRRQLNALSFFIVRNRLF